MLILEFFYGLLIVGLFYFVVRKWKFFSDADLSKNTYSYGYLVRILSGVIFLYIYTSHYGQGNLTADAQAFLDQSYILNQVFYKSPTDYFKFLTGIGDNHELTLKYLSQTHHWEAGSLTFINDNKNLLRIHSIIHFFSFKNAYIHMAVSCFLSHIGFRFLFISLKKFVAFKSQFFFWILLLAPSTLFWTSTVLKEPLLFLGIGFLCAFLFLNAKIYLRFFYGLIGFLLLLSFKPYVFFCALAVIILFGIYKLFRNWWFTFGTVFILAIIVFATLKPQLDFALHVISRKQFDFVNVGKGGVHVVAKDKFYYFNNEQKSILRMNGVNAELLKPTDAFISKFGSIDEEIPIHLEPNGDKWSIAFISEGCTSYIEVPLIRESYKNLLVFTPKALFNATIRPLPSDPGSWLKYLAFAEMFILLFHAIFSIKNRRTLSIENRNIVFCMLLFAFLLLLLIGWTTPVIGAIVRYRFPAYLAILVSLCILIKPFKIVKWKIIFLSPEQAVE